MKRAIDYIFCFFVITTLFWLFAVLYFIIRMDSKGPAFFIQQRVGYRQQSFNCIKFRTMRQGTLQAGTHDLSSEMITRVGSFLRRFKIDELPQIINLLRGDMTLIGPRPCLPVQKKLIEARSKLGVYDVLPGITGLSQVNGIDMSTPEKLAASDADYIQQISLGTDMRILYKTLVGRGFGDRIRKTNPNK